MMSSHAPVSGGHSWWLLDWHSKKGGNVSLGKKRAGSKRSLRSVAGNNEHLWGVLEKLNSRQTSDTPRSLVTYLLAVEAVQAVEAVEHGSERSGSGWLGPARCTPWVGVDFSGHHGKSKKTSMLQPQVLLFQPPMTVFPVDMHS
jgi:hypothetical protein